MCTYTYKSSLIHTITKNRFPVQLIYSYEIYGPSEAKILEKVTKYQRELIVVKKTILYILYSCVRYVGMYVHIDVVSIHKVNLYG